jgi:two-component system OmpR family response regulator
MGKTPQEPEAVTITINNLEVDGARHRAVVGGNTLELSPKEFDLLAFLAKNRSLVFSREQLLEKVWGYDYAGDTRTVDVHIRWLRQKIEADPAHPVRIVTVRGTGYKLEG